MSIIRISSIILIAFVLLTAALPPSRLPMFASAVIAGEAAPQSSSTGGGTGGSAGGGKDFSSGIITEFENAAKKWEKTFMDLAQKVFWILAAIALVVKFAPIVLGGGSRDFGDFCRELVMFVLTTGVLFFLVQESPALFRSLVDFFYKTPVNARLASDITPQALLSNGIQMISDTSEAFWEGAEKMFTYGTPGGLPKIKVTDGASWASFLATVVLNACHFLLGIVLLLIVEACCILYALVAAKYVLLMVGSYIVCYAGIIILGFSSFGFTRDVIISYYKTAAGFGIQLMCYVLLVNVGQSQLQTLQKAMKIDTFPVTEFLTYLCCTFIWWKVLETVPPMVAQICGTPSMQTPSMSSIGGAAAGLAMGGAGLAVGASQGAGAAIKAADAAAHASGSKGGASMSQKITAGLKGAAGATAQGVGAAVKTAAQGGSFGSAMASAADGSKAYSTNIGNQMKEAQQEQKQAQRDETQAQIAQNLGTLTAALNPTSATAGDGGSGNGGSGDGGSGNGNNGGERLNPDSESVAKGLDGRLTGQQPGGNDPNITADATREQAPANGGNAAPQTDPAAAPRSGNPKNAAAQPPKPTGNAPKRNGNAQKPATSQAAKNTVYDPHKPIPPIDS